MYCPKCGKEILDQSRFCQYCGAELKTDVTTSNPVPPIQPTAAYPNPKSSKKGRKMGCLLFVLLFFGSLMFGIFQIIQNPEQYQKKSILMKEMNLTAEQEQDILKIFGKCGIGEISKVERFQSGDTHTSYYLTDNEVSQIVVWVSSEGKIESIYFHDNDIYVNGKVVNPITDFYVNSNDKDEYRTISESAIKKLLNHPNTAKFPGISKWKFGIDDGIIIVQSYVTAKNSFGVEDTIDFQVKFNKHKKIVSLIMDGTEYIR